MDWRARAQESGTPIVEGSIATFVWLGGKPPLLVGDLLFSEESDTYPEPITLDKSNRDVWTHTISLPSDAYIEYFFIDEDTGERIVDPLNPRSITNGMGEYNNYFAMNNVPIPPYSRRKRSHARGTIQKHSLSTEGFLATKSRDVWLYSPAVNSPVPLLVVYDGNDYLRRAKIIQTVDTMIAQKRIEPIALGLVSHGRIARMAEYGCSDTTLAFLCHVLLPFAKEQLTLIDTDERNGAYGVMGTSMGGLMALYTGLRMPNIFGKVFSQSGAFNIPLWDFITTDMVEHLPKRELKIWLDVGRYEILVNANRDMRELLESNGYQPGYFEHNAGHNYTAWSAHLHRGLEHLFGTGEIK